MFYRVTPGFYKVQWVGESITLDTESQNRSPRSSLIIQQSSSFQSTKRLPTVFEGDEDEDEKVETSQIEVLCLSSDSDPGQGEESNSDSSHIGEEDVLIFGSPKEGKSRKDLFGGAGKISFNTDVASANNNRASRHGMSGGSRNFLTKSTADVTASHSESLVDLRALLNQSHWLSLPSIHLQILQEHHGLIAIDGE